MTDLDGTQRLRQTLAGLLGALALYLMAWNEVPVASGSLTTSLAGWIHPALGLADARVALRGGVGLLAVAGVFFGIAGMGNTLGLIPLFGGRIALSARLAGLVLGTLLTLAAAVIGHLSSTPGLAALTVTPLPAALLLLLWLSRREPTNATPHASTRHPAPLLLDLPDRVPAGIPEKRQEPTLPGPAPAAPRTSQPATFTARAPRQSDGQADLSPLEFDSGIRSTSARNRAGATGPDLGLPPLEFTPSARPAGAPARPAPATVNTTPRSAPATTPPAAAPLRIEDGLPPLEFPGTPAGFRPVPPSPPRAPVERPTLDTLDFTATPRRPAAAPLADELAQWSPRPTSPVVPPPAPVAAPAPAAATRPPAELPQELPPGAMAFTLDTVAPRELGPRRALLDDEPDLLAQLGALSQVPTPPSAPVPANAPVPAAIPPRPSPIVEPERVKLADKGVFSIYKLIESGAVVGYALTEHGMTVAVGTQDQVKQVLRERWPGHR